MPSSDLFSANAALIDAVLNASCRVHRLAPDHADEFRSWATVRLLDHEQAISASSPREARCALSGHRRGAAVPRLA